LKGGKANNLTQPFAPDVVSGLVRRKKAASFEKSLLTGEAQKVFARQNEIGKQREMAQRRVAKKKTVWFGE